MRRPETSEGGTARVPGPRLRLLLHAFLVLFLELALIRWAGSLVVHLSYFTNFILLGSFLGIGIGFLRAGSRRSLFPWAPIGLAALVAVVHLSTTRIPDEGVELLYFGGSPGETGLPAWVVLPAIFVAVAMVMALTAHGLARAFAKFEPLAAYRLDILGSLLGIGAFSALSFVDAPPLAWGAVVAGLFLLLSFPRFWIPLVGCLVILPVLGIQSFQADSYYSPYYKIDVRPKTPEGWIPILVNGTPHQQVEAVSQLRVSNPRYFEPYAGIEPPKRVLVIGAGTGLDVAVALAQGAEHVDAVEIDPVLVDIGRALNPDQPYDDPRVSVHVDDGRAFLERTDESYDLIVFSLPDSLTLLAGQAGLRLESYLFTKEAITSAKDHLNPDGTFALYGYFPSQWMTDRMAGLVGEVFNRPPCLPGGLALPATKYVPARGSLIVNIIDGPGLCSVPWEPRSDVVAAPTDDRPFPYLRGAAVPKFYWYALALMALASLLGVGLAGGRALGSMRGYLDLFFMGAAFLLLETRAVVQFALLFGTTWFVNALAFAGILLVVLASVEVARRVRLRRPIMLYPLLFLSLAVAWLIPPGSLLSLPMFPRLVAAVLLSFTAVFVANLIFSERFRDVEASTTAFGANLLGAMFGGLLEYAALVMGYRFLLVLTALLYALALVFGRRFLLERT